jgi:hypothetical protein
MFKTWHSWGFIKETTWFLFIITWNAHEVILHVIRSFLVWQEMIIQAMGTPFFHLLNTIKVNKWNLTINPKNHVLGKCFIMTPFEHAFDLPWSWFPNVKGIATFGSLSYWKKTIFWFSNAHSWTFNASFFAWHFCFTFIMFDILQFKNIIFCHGFTMFHLFQLKLLVFFIYLWRSVTHFQSWNNLYSYKKSQLFKKFNLTKVSTLTKRMLGLINVMGHER